MSSPAAAEPAEPWESDSPPSAPSVPGAPFTTTASATAAPAPVAPAPDSTGDEAEVATSTPRRRRRLALGAFTLWTLGAVAVGVAAGYEVWDRVSPHSAGPITVQRALPATVSSTEDDEVVMPDVVSLPRMSALEAVASAGVDPSSVVLTSRPYAAPVGSVVSQEPLGGTTSPQEVRLVLAAAAVMPKTIGTAADAAIGVLEELGAVVQTRQVYAQGVPVGDVVRSTPAAGAPLDGPATLLVSSAPASLFLSDLTASRLDCSTGSAPVAGKDYTSSITCRGGSADPAIATWVVDKKVDGVTFAAGLSSDSDPAGTGRVVVRADGKALRTVDLRFGSARGITLPLSGVTQLSVEVTGTDGVTVVLGDARVLGTPAGVGALEARS